LRQVAYVKNFFTELFFRRSLIWVLGVRELRKKYFGSILGIAWIFIEQLAFVAVLWTVFTKGFKFSPAGDLPFLPWFIASYMLWIFMSTFLTSSTQLFQNYSFLLKKWKFNISTLPVINMIPFLLIHLVFVFIFICVCLLYRIEPSWFWLQSLYYMFSTLVFLLGVSWFIASVSLFVHDIRNVVAIIIQLGFWISPIYWEAKLFPDEYHLYLKLNPMHYLLQGYRDSFIYHEPFWSKAYEGIYFWSIAFFFLLLGMVTYKKLRPHFGDVI